MFRNLLNLIKSYRSIEGTTSADFTDLIIGCSFDPFHHIFCDEKINPIAGLRFVHEELKISNIRLSIRWNEVWKNGELDLSVYEQYFDYCSDNNIKITLNVGPLKVMRWPEIHLAKEFESLVGQHDEVNLEHPIAKPALSYLELLLAEIRNKYGDLIVAIQGDNESFNRFGPSELLISPQFELVVLKTIIKYFPSTPILVSSSATNDIKQILDLIKGFSNKFILGINYYYKTEPHQYRTPIMNKLDNLILRKRFTMSPEAVKASAKDLNYEVEVTELQGEPWWPNALTPGNNYREFVFTLHRCKYLRPENQSTLLARYWGIEDLVVKFLQNTATEQNELIRELITEINSKQEARI